MKNNINNDVGRGRQSHLLYSLKEQQLDYLLCIRISA
jgi:hypothetical protein